ncbi:MAG: zinc dependent phospholipase C family protein [Gemmatimonadota bacterium]
MSRGGRKLNATPLCEARSASGEPKSRRRRLLAAIAALSPLLYALLWLVLTPGEAWAWGPATHIAIGEAVLSSLHLLPPAIQGILDRNRLSFLYGSVAADISFAKKYAAVGRHSHHWHIGDEILESAESEEMRAVGLGYLSHLAADTIAHNYFVPRRLLLTSTSSSVGHTYWEHRMDVHLGKRFGGEARRIVLYHDHSQADELFDRVLSRTLFSFRTNRRLFRGMIAFQDDDRWKLVFDEILRRSRFDLPGDARDRYVQLSYDYVMDYLVQGKDARASALDPVGDAHLQLSKTLRREALLEGGRTDPAALHEVAEAFFPLPKEPLLYVPKARGIEVPGLSREPPDEE